MSNTYASRVTQGWGATATCAYCHGFAKIPTLIRGTDGRMHMNPDAEMVKRFISLAQPFGFVIPAGGTQDFSITPPAEDEDLGDLLINEFMAKFTPNTVRNLTVEFLNLQTNRVLQNAPIWNTLVFGNAQLNCCLPCCTLVQATNSLILRITNNEVVPVAVEVTARGKRFVPKTTQLRARMLMYWNTIPTYPYFQTLDLQEVVVPAGGSISALMTVQGTGDFEIKYPRCEVIPAGPGVVTADDILVQITEQIGRELQDAPMSLGAFVATPTLVIPGFPGDLYRAASACLCPPAGQLMKRNTRWRFDFTNPTATPARVRFTYAGCFHQVDECPPGRSMDRIRSIEPTIGPLLVPQGDYCPPGRQVDPYPAMAPSMPARQQPAPYRLMPPQPAAPANFQLPMYGAAAPGYIPGVGYAPPPMPLVHGPGQQRIAPGQVYRDPVTGEWRRA